MPIELTQIDVAVHLDFFRRLRSRQPLDEEDIERFEKCDSRVSSLASQNNYALLYFSSFLIRDSHGNLVENPGSRNPDAIDRNNARVNKYQSLLGERFIMFAGREEPSSQELKAIFADRRLYKTEKTKLTVYGEWEDYYVDIYRTHLRRELGLSPYNCTIDSKLSLHSEYPEI